MTRAKDISKIVTDADLSGTLDVTGTVTVGDGAVGTPAISFASDTNTGIYRGGTDILKFVTAGTDAVTIDASQNVTLAGSVTGVTKITVNGTGTSNFTSTATSPIQINGTSIPTLTIRNSTTPVELQMRATTGEGLVRTSTNHPLVFAVNASEKARIDTSGNLLVGKTSSNLSTAGSEFASDGLVRFTRSNVNAVVNFNKLNNDGDIVSFRKDDTQVGSIGNNGTELFIGTPSGSGGYIRLQSAGIVPATSTGANSDGTMQLGTASGRFSDLYLSGSVLTSNIYGQNDGNTGIQFEGSDLITIHTGGAERMRIDANGHVTMPNQPAFSAKLSSSQSNIAVGSDLSVQFNTEIFDQNADFNTANYTFTAPVTGRYQFNIYYYLENIDTATGYYYIFFDTSNRNYFNIISPAFTSDTSYLTLTLSVLVDMDANDVAVAKIRQSHGTSQTDINANSYFSGYLVA